MNSIGQFIQPQMRGHFNTHYQYSGGNRMFSAVECDAIVALGESLPLQSGAIGNPDQSRVDNSYRCVDVGTLAYNQKTAWIYERVHQRVQACNDEDYKFELTGLLEEFQFLRYTAAETQGEPPGHYNWHQDFGAHYMSRRKISVCAQLSDPQDYDGCNLMICDPGPKLLNGIYAERGAAVLFPSWTPHCVTTITRGKRYALVAWVHGRPFT
jgi:PKHD-type hydroxylase